MYRVAAYHPDLGINTSRKSMGSHEKSRGDGFDSEDLL